MSTGLSEGIYLSSSDGKRYGSEFFIGQGSFFIDSKKVAKRTLLVYSEIACAVGSAMQRWRYDKGEADEDVGEPLLLDHVRKSKTSVSKMLSAGSSVEPIGYRDPKIRAGIWRATALDEMGPLPPKQISVVCEYLRIVFGQRGKNAFQGQLRLEAALRFPNLIKEIAHEIELDEWEIAVLGMNEY